MHHWTLAPSEFKYLHRETIVEFNVETGSVMEFLASASSIGFKACGVLAAVNFSLWGGVRVGWIGSQEMAALFLKGGWTFAFFSIVLLVVSKNMK
ncbi:MAG: hypothetical protein JF621_14990 [Streptomyces turgidiscabies]|nr:hypothetical protein [Streptomyces turgidiscabies]